MNYDHLRHLPFDKKPDRKPAKVRSIAYRIRKSFINMPLPFHNHKPLGDLEAQTMDEPTEPRAQLPIPKASVKPPSSGAEIFGAEIVQAGPSSDPRSYFLTSQENYLRKNSQILSTILPPSSTPTPRSQLPVPLQVGVQPTTIQRARLRGYTGAQSPHNRRGLAPPPAPAASSPPTPSFFVPRSPHPQAPHTHIQTQLPSFLYMPEYPLLNQLRDFANENAAEAGATFPYMTYSQPRIIAPKPTIGVPAQFNGKYYKDKEPVTAYKVLRDVEYGTDDCAFGKNLPCPDVVKKVVLEEGEKKILNDMWAKIRVKEDAKEEVMKGNKEEWMSMEEGRKLVEQDMEEWIKEMEKNKGIAEWVEEVARKKKEKTAEMIFMGLPVGVPHDEEDEKEVKGWKRGLEKAVKWGKERRRSSNKDI